MKKFRLRSLFSLAVAGILLSSVALTGCSKADAGSTNGSSSLPSGEVVTELKLPLVDKPVTITWMVPSDVENLNDLPVIQEIRDRTGIDLQMMPFPTKSYVEKLNTMIGSGELPDIVNGMDLSQVNSYGQVGAFASITDYLNELPNFRKLYVDDPETNWVMYSWASDDGDVYKWPIYKLARDVNHGILYRADIFEEQGIEPWTNTEEFYDALVKLKEAYPSSYPFSSKNGANTFKDLAKWWNVSDSRFPFYFDESDNTWKFAGSSEPYKEMLDLMKKMYTNGLLDPEFLTDTQDSWSAKMTNDQSFVAWDWVGRMSLLQAQVGSANPSFDLQFGRPIGSGKQHSLPKIDNFGPVVSKGDNELAALKLLDYLTSPEGSELFTLGIEGEIFEFDADGKPVYTQLSDEEYIDIHLLEEKYGMWVEGCYVNPDHRSVYYNYTEAEQRAQDLCNNETGYNPTDPEIKLTDEEAQKYASILLKAQKELETFSSNYVINSAYTDADWDKFVSNADSFGVNEALEILNAAQVRYDENV